MNILYTTKSKCSVGVVNGVYYIQTSPLGYWKEIPAKTEEEALKYLMDNYFPGI